MRKSLQEQFCKLMLQKEIKWKQRSRNKWLEAGNCSTIFFHATVNACRRVNRINSIVQEINYGRIRKTTRKKLFFSSSNYIKEIIMVDPEWMGFLSASFQVLQFLILKLTSLKKTVFGLGRDRAPGPDGFIIAFFQIFWNLTEADLRVFFQQIS